MFFIDCLAVGCVMLARILLRDGSGFSIGCVALTVGCEMLSMRLCASNGHACVDVATCSILFCAALLRRAWDGAVGASLILVPVCLLFVSADAVAVAVALLMCR